MGGNPHDGTVDVAVLLANANSYGNNTGSIFINSETGDQEVAVGSRAGQTTALGYDITLRGSDDDNDRWAQRGWRAPNANLDVEILTRIMQ